jgi:hypothetical protein
MRRKKILLTKTGTESIKICQFTETAVEEKSSLMRRCGILVTNKAILRAKMLTLQIENSSD